MNVVASLGVRRRVARAGVRLALVQALVVVVAFALAGALTRMSVAELDTSALRERVTGEAQSLREEYQQRGAEHLPHTIAKRGRLWKGFGYGLVSRQDARVAGDLAAKTLGWSEIAGIAGAQDRARRPFLVLTETLPDGSRLAVGHDLSAHIRQSGALTRMLLLSGAVGVSFCVAASWLFTRHTWRRIAAVTKVAGQVREGDLTARIVLQDRPARDDMDDLGIVFNAMLGRVGLLVEQVRQVSTDIAHDLRTPLTRVRQRLGRLRSEAERDPVFARGLQQVDDDISEILRTFDALLQLAEIGGVRDMSRDREFDLADVAGRVGEAFRPDIEESGRRFDVTLQSASVRGDERLVAQAVANLLENAIRHCPLGTHVSLRVEGGGSPALVVVDDGPGIPEADRGAVLRPLVRLEASRHAAGSGLGLSVVAAIAERHGARIELGAADPGLMVRLRFPSEPMQASSTLA